MHLKMHTISLPPGMKSKAESITTEFICWNIREETEGGGIFILKQLCTFSTAEKCQQPSCVNVMSLLAHVNIYVLVLRLLAHSTVTLDNIE